MKQDGAFGFFFPVRLLGVNYFLQKYQIYLWYQDEISLAEHRPIRPFQYVATGRRKLKQPIMIKEIQWKELEK